MKTEYPADRTIKRDGKLFCIECGDELERFDLSKDALDKRAILLRWEKCRKSGKFNGEFCARYFIAFENTPPESEEN